MISNDVFWGGAITLLVEHSIKGNLLIACISLGICVALAYCPHTENADTIGPFVERWLGSPPALFAASVDRAADDPVDAAKRPRKKDE